MTGRFVPLAAEDARRLHAAEQRAFAVPWSEAAYRAELSRPFCRAVGAVEGDALVGAVCVWCLPPQGEILRIFSVPESRQRGIARALLARGIALCAAAGCAEVVLEVGAHNAPALALYRSMGFVRVGRRPGYYRGGEDAWVLARPAGRRPRGLDAACGLS